MSVGAYALISIEDYFAYAGIYNNDILIEGFTLYCSAGNASAATVVKSGNTLTLKITGGTSADTDALDLTAAANDTLAELIAVINALGGWTAQIISSGYSSLDSTYLNDFVEVDVLAVANKKTLEAFDFRKYEQLIDHATNIIEDSLHRQILSRDYPLERYSGGHSQIFLKQYPVTAIQLVSEGKNDVIDVIYTDTTKFNAYIQVTSADVILMAETTVINTFSKTGASYDTLTEMVAAIHGETSWEATLLDPFCGPFPSNLLIPVMNLRCMNQKIALSFPDEPLDGYKLNSDQDILTLPRKFYGGYEDIFISTTAGYSATPDAVKRGTLRFCQYMEDREDDDMAMKTERLGDYNYSRFGANELRGALGVELFNELMAYRRMLV